MKMRSEVGATLKKQCRTACIFAGFLVMGFSVTAQQLYDDQELSSDIKYVTHPDGRVTPFVQNPKKDEINSSEKCAMFKRNRQKYDYIKFNPSSKLDDVSAYASFDANAPRLTMKVYTDAPAGSVVELQLGQSTGKAYPDGIHSQFQATTTVSGSWEVLEFKYVDTPKGSKTNARQIDQITMLFMPGTSAQYTFYFDDIVGPAFKEERAVKLFRKK